MKKKKKYKRKTEKKKKKKKRRKERQSGSINQNGTVEALSFFIQLIDLKSQLLLYYINILK